jgi:hypothetical protein
MYLVKSFFIVYKRLAEANEQLDVLNLDDQQCLNNESWEMVLHYYTSWNVLTFLAGR